MRRIALFAVCATTAARAEPPRDPRDAFTDHRAAAKQVDCSDGLAFGCTSATDPLAEATPFALSTWLSADYLLALPTGDSTHDQVAHYAMGASRDDAGPAFGGATGLDNRWTIEGAPTDDPWLGGVGTRVPLAFLQGMLVTAGGFAARDRASTGGTIDARLVRGGDHHEVHARAYVQLFGDPAAPPAIADTYFPRSISAAAGPAVSASVVATGPVGALLGGRAWYAVGVAAQLHLTDFTWQASRLVDRNGDGIPDGFPGLLVTEPIETTATTVPTYTVPLLARVGLDRGAHHVDVTLVGNVQSSAFFLADSTLQAAGVNSVDAIGDAIATYRGEWRDTRAKLQVAWHHATHHESARDPNAAGVPQLQTAYVPAMLADDPTIAVKCNDPNSTLQSQCPVPAGWFASAGAGELDDRSVDRVSLGGDLAHRFGAHVGRVGATVEESRVLATIRYTGNELDRSLFPTELSQQKLVDPNGACSLDVTQPCATTSSVTLAWPTLYTAAYVEDTWTPAPGLAVDGGLRWELMWVGTELHLSDELAPRLGVSWEHDLESMRNVGGGRLRLFTAMGRSFAMLPAGLGSAIIPGAQTVQVITSPFGTGRVIDTGAPLAVAPGVDPMIQDEVVAGADFEAARTVRVRAWVQARQLERGLAVTARGLDNPGKNDEPPAARDTALVALEVWTSPIAKTALRAGYSFGVAQGTSSFAFDPRRGPLLYLGDDYNASLSNLYGRLPSDQGHRVYVEAIRRGALGPLAVAVATRLTVNSGLARDVLGDSDTGIVRLLPRGAGGRGQLVSQANLRLAARWRKIDVALDVFDLLDRRAVLDVDQIYAGGSIRPIDNGAAADLVFLKDSGGAVPSRRPGFLVPNAFQAPVSAVLGVHRAF